MRRLGVSDVRVVIADALGDTAARLAEYLRPVGFEVDAVRDGEQALEVFHRTNARALVTDLTLPSIPAETVALALRQEFGAAVRLIAFSDWPPARYSEVALDGVFDEIAAKPVDPAAVFAALSLENARIDSVLRAANIRRVDLMLELHETLVKFFLLDRAEGPRKARALLARTTLLLARAPLDAAQRRAADARLAGIHEAAASPGELARLQHEAGNVAVFEFEMFDARTGRWHRHPRYATSELIIELRGRAIRGSAVSVSSSRLDAAGFLRDD